MEKVAFRYTLLVFRYAKILIKELTLQRIGLTLNAWVIIHSLPFFSSLDTLFMAFGLEWCHFTMKAEIEAMSR